MPCPREKILTSMLKLKMKTTVKSFSGTIEIWNRYLEEMLNHANQVATNDFRPLEKIYSNHLFEQYLYYQAKERVQYKKEFDFQFSHFTHKEITLLNDMLIDSRHVYSQHKLDLRKTRQNIHVTLKPNVELKSQKPSKIPLHLEETIMNFPTQLRDAYVIGEMEKDDKMR